MHPATPTGTCWVGVESGTAGSTCGGRGSPCRERLACHAPNTALIYHPNTTKTIALISFCCPASKMPEGARQISPFPTCGTHCIMHLMCTWGVVEGSAHPRSCRRFQRCRPCRQRLLPQEKSGMGSFSCRAAPTQPITSPYEWVGTWMNHESTLCSVLRKKLWNCHILIWYFNSSPRNAVQARAWMAANTSLFRRSRVWKGGELMVRSATYFKVFLWWIINYISQKSMIYFYHF